MKTLMLTPIEIITLSVILQKVGWTSPIASIKEHFIFCGLEAKKRVNGSENAVIIDHLKDKISGFNNKLKLWQEYTPLEITNLFMEINQESITVDIVV